MTFHWRVGVPTWDPNWRSYQLPAEALASVEETISALSYAEQAAGIRNRHRAGWVAHLWYIQQLASYFMHIFFQNFTCLLSYLEDYLPVDFGVLRLGKIIGFIMFQWLRLGNQWILTSAGLFGWRGWELDELLVSDGNTDLRSSWAPLVIVV